MTNKKVLVLPHFDKSDVGEGGIRRVVEAQTKYLPEYGWDVVSDASLPHDIVAVHGGDWLNTDKPVVSHSHGLYWTPEYNWHKTVLEVNQRVIDASRRANVVTAPSEWVARILKRGLWRDTPVLHHGIEPSDWEPGDKSVAYVLWNKSRPDPICDPNDVHKLALLAGDTQFISTFGKTSSNVSITGRLPYEEAKRYVERASVYLCTTRETFGIGTLEAMACAVPILGFAWGGQREIVTHKEHGWLATPGDFDSLLEGLHYCLEYRERLGESARAHVLGNFTWRSAIARYAPIYDNVYRGSQSRSTRPKVSVIITCYNLAETLPRAMDSVKAQTYKDWEVVIVDDASPDSTPEVAATLTASDPRIRYHRNPNNLYLAGALNAGIGVARGQYILPLDADNEIAPQTLEVLAKALDERDLDIVYGKMKVIETDGKEYVSEWPPKEFSLKDQLAHKNQITSTSMYRKSIWWRVGGYRRRCHTAEDADFWCRATSFGAKAARVSDDPLLIYHNRPDSMSNVNKDWAWHQWYPWGRVKNLLPMGAVSGIPAVVRTDEPVKITVVIPVGPGHEELVVDAVDSLVAQTFTQWDCIVVNDSGKPLPWIHPFAKVIETPGGLGPAMSRNLGVQACTTKLWLPLDADDFLQPESLEALYKAWSPGYYVYSDWVVHETGVVHTTPEYNCKDLVRLLPHAVTALYEKTAWESVGGFDTSLKAWEDWDFILALASKGVCGIRVALPLLHYRMHAGSRREALYADRDELKKEISTKWHKYIVEGHDLMACGGCGKKRTVVSAPMNTTTTSGAPSVDVVKLVFKGTGGTRTYKGKETGRVYRFGADPQHREGYVFTADAEHLLLRPLEFRKADDQGSVLPAPTELLMAQGPPKRD